jgi:hypothetical protein
VERKGIVVLGTMAWEEEDGSAGNRWAGISRIEERRLGGGDWEGLCWNGRRARGGEVAGKDVGSMGGERLADIACTAKLASARIQAVGYAACYGWSDGFWVLEGGKGDSRAEVRRTVNPERIEHTMSRLSIPYDGPLFFGNWPGGGRFMAALGRKMEGWMVDGMVG